ncbi:hypothetical protein DSO57_1029962 [Entomophthora muscae]|uniref:Uncharacterized protein n=1 Tax=Entomophthora muscae TaxID=34485 RepID=A0ACC2TD62_9FUNG|nr:hypothetical protein DSO57_1029962 [Entomophthora muscae]
MVSHKSAPVDRVEPVYGTNYSVSYLTLRNATTLGISQDLKLPSLNPFLSEENEVIDYDFPRIYNTLFNIPQRILVDQSGEMWVMPVNSSKAVLFISVALPQQITLEDFVKVELFSRIKFESLGEMNYHLSKAGNYYSVEPKEDCLQFKIIGFNKNIGLIVEMILKTMFAPRVGRGEYEMFKFSVKALDWVANFKRRLRGWKTPCWISQSSRPRRRWSML